MPCLTTAFRLGRWVIPGLTCSADSGRPLLLPLISSRTRLFGTEGVHKYQSPSVTLCDNLRVLYYGLRRTCQCDIDTASSGAQTLVVKRYVDFLVIKLMPYSMGHLFDTTQQSLVTDAPVSRGRGCTFVLILTVRRLCTDGHLHPEMILIESEVGVSIIERGGGRGLCKCLHGLIMYLLQYYRSLRPSLQVQ